MPRVKIPYQKAQADRIKQMLSYFGESAQELANKIGVKRLNSLDNVILGRHGITPALVTQIKKVHKRISPEWLTIGKGDMLLTEEQFNSETEIDKPCQQCIEKDKIIVQYQNMIESFTTRYNTIIDKQEELIVKLTETVDQQYKRIDQLESGKTLRKS